MTIAAAAALALGLSLPADLDRAITAACPNEACVVDAVVWGAHESSLTALPRPWSWDAHAGISCGPWQTPCSGPRTVDGQARLWVRMRAGSLARWGDLRELPGVNPAGVRIARARAEEAEDVRWALEWAR